jgi:hypothetical protein
MEDKAKGRMKEAAGAFTGDEDKKAEGRAQQRKGAAGEEAAQKATPLALPVYVAECAAPLIKKPTTHLTSRSGLEFPPITPTFPTILA